MSSPNKPLYSPSVIQSLFNQYGLSPNKALGQNFLADGNTVERIVRAVEITQGDVVLEIGPGVGALTQGLLRAGARVIAVEKDRGLADLLGTVLSDATIIHGDALKTDLKSLLPSGTTRCKVAANLPYYITSPLIMHVLESDLPWDRLVVMIQKEVAERIVAKPGTKQYGILTVAVGFYAEAEVVGTVPPTVFIPQPKVHSEILSLTPKTEPIDVGDERLFFSVVRASFGQRRKTIRNALGTLISDETGLSRDQLDRALVAAGIDPRRRGETLSLDEFACISRELFVKSI